MDYCFQSLKDRAFYTIDRFHVAKAIRSIFRKHPRYRNMRVVLASFDGEAFLTELNSAVGTLGDGEKELEALIHQLEVPRSTQGLSGMAEGAGHRYKGDATNG